MVAQGDARKSFFGGLGGGKCCQCGNVASSNVAKGQWGVENVANVEVLPVPMLPMANGAGAEANWEVSMKAWLPRSDFFTPSAAVNDFIDTTPFP